MCADAEVEPPPMIGTTTPAKVAKAVARAIERNRNEITVAPRRQRFIAEIGYRHPEFAARVQRRGGAEQIAYRARRGPSRQALARAILSGRVIEDARRAEGRATVVSRHRRGNAEARVGVGQSSGRWWLRRTRRLTSRRRWGSAAAPWGISVPVRQHEPAQHLTELGRDADRRQSRLPGRLGGRRAIPPDHLGPRLRRLQAQFRRHGEVHRPRLRGLQHDRPGVPRVLRLDCVGGLPAARRCDNGYIHLMDDRYEISDAQFFAGELADEGLADGQRVGAVGGSYGGGLSLQLATLKDRVMMPDGSLVPWTSPVNGIPMRIAARPRTFRGATSPTRSPPTGTSSTTSPIRPTPAGWESRRSRSSTVSTRPSRWVPASTAVQAPFPSPCTDFDADVTAWNDAPRAG